jgi:hypothetical protein
MKWTWILFFSVLIGAQAQEPPRAHIAYYTKTPIDVDGKDNDRAWGKVDWSDSFIDIEGVKTPTYDTKVKMLWDDNFYYIFAKIEEPHVWATLKDHDAIMFHNNDFEVFIDPNGNTHGYYELEFNALNTLWDLFVVKPYRDEGNETLNEWEALGIKSAVNVEGTLNNPKDKDTGWTIEIAIPFKSLRTNYFHLDPPKDRFWRVNFSRVNWDFDLEDNRYTRKKGDDGKLLHEYNWVWSPQGVISMHQPETWGYVYFSSKKAGQKDSFGIPQDDWIKWKMYAVYRAQRDHYKENREWLSKEAALPESEMVINGSKVKFSIEYHQTGWNLSTISPFTNRALILTHTGKFIKR